MTTGSLRRLPALGLVALVAVAAFGWNRSEYMVALSAVSVLLVVGSLYLMFSRPAGRSGG